MNSLIKNVVSGFIFGFLSTLIFHQCSLWLLSTASGAGIPTWDFSPVPPYGVPKVISLSFFGGLWGIPIVYMLSKLSSFKFWLASIITGAIFPTAVAMLVVFPMKGLAVTPQIIVVGLFVNGMWGLGVATFHQLYKRIISEQ